MKVHRPNFVQIVSDKFNVMSGDTIIAYEVPLLLDEEYSKWCSNIITVIKIMEERGFMEYAIVDEIKKQLNRNLLTNNLKTPPAKH